MKIMNLWPRLCAPQVQPPLEAIQKTPCPSCCVPLLGLEGPQWYGPPLENSSLTTLASLTSPWRCPEADMGSQEVRDKTHAWRCIPATIAVESRRTRSLDKGSFFHLEVLMEEPR